MRRIFYTLSLAVAAISLSQCAFREQEAPEAEGGVAFELFARSAETKTVNDGFSTKWEVGDEISVYHCVPGAKTPTFDGVFEIDDAEKGHAKGTVKELSSGSYDWFLFYPGSTEAPSQPGGYVTIEPNPSQSGNDSRAHLAGPGFPLGGKADKVLYTATPSVTLHPLLNVVEVHVTNAQALAARVKSVSFTAPEAVSGKFEALWDGSFTARGDNSETLSLSVEGGALLDQGASASFYMGMKPFQAAAGSLLTLSVTMVTEDGREAVQEKSVSLPAATAFKSGSIKTLNFSFSEAFPEPQTYTFRKVSALKGGHHYLFVAEYNGVYYAGRYFDPSVSSGRMEVREVTPVQDVITLNDYDGAFRFSPYDDSWQITQPDGRYLYNNNADNIGVSATPVAGGMLWTVSFVTGGGAEISNRTRQIKFNTASTVLKFQSRQKTASGLVPYLYELENDILYEEEFKSLETPGVYGVNGHNWLYNEAGDQTSVLKQGSVLSFRILTPATYTALQLTGPPQNPAVGDYCSVEIKRFVKLNPTYSETLSFKALKHEGNKLWLLSDNGIGIIALTD